MDSKSSMIYDFIKCPICNLVQEIGISKSGAKELISIKSLATCSRCLKQFKIIINKDYKFKTEA